ncbi:MAG: type III-B CRISPR module-associated Cmr3 family protein [Verrucomicrobiota bacterium]|nr:type III-B CRISPR module-associated Cmr3 family protein [Verrucomicrobiota bacterium]
MTALHQILLEPTDVLFFRDGRPMNGASPGYTAAWPLPDIVNHALHAALHRAGFQDAHAHRHGRSGDYSNDRTRKFGCLTTAGPFPVRMPKSKTASDLTCTWYLPRPKDTQIKQSVKITLKPLRSLTPDVDDLWRESSLPKPLKYAVVNAMPPSKDTGGEPWISSEAYQAYLSSPATKCDPTSFLKDEDIADTECTIGIGIDPATGTAGQGEAEGQIYSAHYLRLLPDFRLGLFAQALDKTAGNPDNRRDLVRALLNDCPKSIVVGGQQRLCTACRSDAPVPLPLPLGLSTGFNEVELNGWKRWLVKWVLI